MYLLSATGILKEFQGEPLTSPLTFNIDENEKIALIGSNGCGKSTLIKMLIGELEPDKGHVTLSKNCTIGYLSQSVISDLSHTLYEEAEEVFKPLMEEEKFLEDLCEKLPKILQIPNFLILTLTANHFSEKKMVITSAIKFA